MNLTLFCPSLLLWYFDVLVLDFLDSYPLIFFFNVNLQFVGDVDSQFGNITGDFSGVNILTGETRNILIDFRDGEADQITWDPFLREVIKSEPSICVQLL